MIDDTFININFGQNRTKLKIDNLNCIEFVENMSIISIYLIVFIKAFLNYNYKRFSTIIDHRYVLTYIKMLNDLDIVH